MIIPRYVPGAWHAVVADGSIALLAPQTLPEIVELIWASIREGEGIDTQLELLTQGRSRSFPPFGLVSVADGVMRSYLRGEVELTVRGGEVDPAPGVAMEITVDRLDAHAPPMVYTGGDKAWVSVVIHDMDEVRLAAPGSRVTGASFPVLAAVVQASELLLDLTAGRAARGAEVRANTTGHGGRARHSAQSPSAQSPSARTAASVPSVSSPSATDFDEELDGLTILDPGYLARIRAQADQISKQSAAATAPSAAAFSGTSSLSAVSSPTPRSPEEEEPKRPDKGARSAPSHLRVVPSVQAPETQQRAEPLLPPPPPPPGLPLQASARVEMEEDHDGLTIMSSDLVAIRSQLPSWRSDEGGRSFDIPEPAPAPQPARLMMSSGLVVNLDRTVLIGRAPVVSRVSAQDLPRVVTVESPNHDVSRTHAQVRAEGGRVFVTDLNSMNGVLLLVPDREPQRLRPGVPTVVGDGVTVDIGDGVSFRVVQAT